jgi:diguanylate cyclase (GGDEF)-like protein
VIGRAPEADVTLRLPSVSRQHAKIVRTDVAGGQFFEISDLGSMNGTLVNNVEVRSAILQNNDKIQLGDVVLKFVLQDSHEALYHRELRRRIQYDQLTGLLTIDAFKRDADELIRSAPKSQRVTLAMTDLDGLKRVNDAHGHLMGSRVIKKMGEVIRGCLRPNDRGGIYGGDEAILLFPDTPLSDALALAESLRLAIEACRFDTQSGDVGVTISQGLAEWPTHGKGIEQLIAAADGALYAAKAAGRNCVRVCGD